MVPNGWREYKLSDLCVKIAVGLAISVTPYMRKIGTKLIRNQNIKRNFFNTNSVVYIDKEFADKNRSKKVYAGDIVAVRTGSNIGEACVVPKEFDGALTFTTLIARPDRSKLSSEFLGLHINSERGISEVHRLMAGGGKPNLNSGELKNYKLLTPPIEEQRKIANILGAWDKAISVTERLIDNSKQQKKALMQQLLTGKKRLLDDSGKPFEGEWEQVTIGSTSTCFSGGTPSRSKEEYYGGDIPWITSGKLNDRFVSSVNEYISELGLKNSSAKVVKNGSLLIAMYGATAGKVAINKLNGATVNQAVLALEPNKHCNNYFLFYLYEVEMVKALKLVQGGQPNLSAAIIKGIKIKIPSLTEQRKIAVILTNADKEVEFLEQQCAHLKQEKKALMQQLLTGKRRVKVDYTEAA